MPVVGRVSAGMPASRQAAIEMEENALRPIHPEAWFVLVDERAAATAAELGYDPDLVT